MMCRVTAIAGSRSAWGCDGSVAIVRARAHEQASRRHRAHRSHGGRSRGQSPVRRRGWRPRDIEHSSMCRTRGRSSWSIDGAASSHRPGPWKSSPRASPWHSTKPDIDSSSLRDDRLGCRPMTPSQASGSMSSRSAARPTICSSTASDSSFTPSAAKAGSTSSSSAMPTVSPSPSACRHRAAPGPDGSFLGSRPRARLSTRCRCAAQVGGAIAALLLPVVQRFMGATRSRHGR